MFELDMSVTTIIITLAVTIVTTYYFIRRHSANRRKYNKIDVRGKTVMLTGANAGIGKETVKVLAELGARVILACRDITKGKAAADDIQKVVPNANLKVKHLDLADLESVKKFADEISSEETGVDILINNAAHITATKTILKDGTELQFMTNHLGHYLLTRLLLPLIERSDVKRVVVISSSLHKYGAVNFTDDGELVHNTGLRQYFNTKLMMCLFAVELHRRYSSRGINVFAVHPGYVKTNLAYNLPLYLGIRHALSQPLQLLYKCFAVNVSKGSETSVYCATAEGIEEESGGYFQDCGLHPWHDMVKDVALACKLWDYCDSKVRNFL